MIGCTGRKTTSHEMNYSSTKGELCSIIYGLRKYEHILHFKKFKLRTDNSALTYLYTIKEPRGIMARWLIEVQSFHFDFSHVPGKINIADHVSRSSHLPEPTEMN